MIKVSVLFFSLFFFSGVFGQEEELVEWIDPIEILPIISESCENSDESCTNENIQKFIASFEFETSDTAAFEYKCYVAFVVEANCSISSIKMMKSNGNKDFDKQVLSHFANLPEFYKPGYQLDKPISTSYVVPLVYVQE